MTLGFVFNWIYVFSISFAYNSSFLDSSHMQEKTGLDTQNNA